MCSRSLQTDRLSMVSCVDLSRMTLLCMLNPFKEKGCRLACELPARTMVFSCSFHVSVVRGGPGMVCRLLVSSYFSNLKYIKLYNFGTI